MSNMVRKGDFLVFIDSRDGRITEFFVSTRSFDLDESFSRGTLSMRKLVDGCFGFRLKDNCLYQLGFQYLVDRKATLEERNTFIQWMRDKGHAFNMNTLELNLNGQ